MFLASFFIGWCEMINSTVSTISIDDQREIGTAGGAAGGARSLISTIGSTLVTTVLSNRLSKTIPATVPAALAATGLSTNSTVLFLTAVANNPAGNFTSIPGVTSSIAAIGLRSYQEASAKAYNTVFLVTILFSVLSIIGAIFAPNCNHLMTTAVNVPVQKESEVLATSTVHTHEKTVVETV
jgi:hypothetical protein